MRLLIIRPGGIWCCGCSKTLPAGEPITVCRCCGRFYCTRCLDAAVAFHSEERERLQAALGGPRDYCMEEVLAVLEKALLEDLLKAIPVPPRDQGH